MRLMISMLDRVLSGLRAPVDGKQQHRRRNIIHDAVRAVIEELEPRQFLTGVAGIPIYTDNFDDPDHRPNTPANVSWSSNTISITPFTNPDDYTTGSPTLDPNHFLGKFDSSVTLKLAQLPEHFALTVSFKLYLMGDVDPSEEVDPSKEGDTPDDSLLGSGSGGPNFTVSGGDASLTADFGDISWGPGTDNLDATYSDPTVGDPLGWSYSPTVDPSTGYTLGSVGTDNSVALGYDLYGRDMQFPLTSNFVPGEDNPGKYFWCCQNVEEDGVYDISFTFDDRNTNSSITFGTDGAFFGIDDIEVDALTPARCSNCDKSNGVPAPDAPGAGDSNLEYAGPATTGPGQQIANGWYAGFASSFETPEGKSVGVYDMDSQLHWFDKGSDGSFTPVLSADQNYKLAASSGKLTMTDPDGNQTVLYDFSADNITSKLAGALITSISADTTGDLLVGSDGSYHGENELYVPNGSYNAGGQPSVLERTYMSDGQQVIDQTLISSSGITLQRKIGGGSFVPVEAVSLNFTYITVGSDTITALESATSSVGGTDTGTNYYRYYTSDTSDGFAGALKYSLGPAAYAQLVADHGSASSASDSTVQDYADDYYTYQMTPGYPKRVATDTAMGGSTNTTTILNNHTNYSDGYNNWDYRLTTDAGNGGEEILYENYLRQPMLDVEKDGSTIRSITYYRYGMSGGATDQLILTVHPNAFVANASGQYYDENDLGLGLNGTDSSFLSNTAGEFDIITYGDSTTASLGTGSGTVGLGDVFGYQKGTYVRQGESTSNTTIQLTALQYVEVATTGASSGIFQVARSTEYADTAGTASHTTSYSYSYDGTRELSMTTSLPVVSATENGPATASTTTTVYDDFGNPAWTKDADGFLNYQEFDPGTGALIKSIVDVNTNLTTNTFTTSLPSGWSSPSTSSYGARLNLITTYVVDALGRTTTLTDPNGNITYTVYDDADNEVRTYPGWNATTHQTTGPVQVSRTDLNNGYSETLTFAYIGSSGLPVNDSGAPDGSESLSDSLDVQLESLSRSYSNDIGQLVRTDDYFDLSGLTYSTDKYIGTVNTNYYTTTYGYDAAGNQNMVKAPTGTINRTVFDGLGREVSQWIGTDDASATDSDPTGSGASGNNMVEVSADQYDNDGMGDSLVTQTTQFPGLGLLMPTRVTQNFYDWRDRLVATKDAVQNSTLGNGSESPSDNTHFITYYDLDNLGEIIGTSKFDGDTVTLSYSGGVPQKPSSSLLVAYTTTLYDDQDRAYKTTTYNVSPTSGTYSTSSSDVMISESWFDMRGDVMASYTSGGPMTQNAYDGAGRLSVTYTTDGGAVLNSGTILTGWSDQTDFGEDRVLTQTEYQYDADGNVILTTTRDAFNTNNTTGILTNASNTTGLAARVYYVANHYDAADRLIDIENVGTDTGSTYTWSSTPATASNGGLLLTVYGYDAAGNMDSVTDPDGIVALTDFDALGRQTKTIANYKSTVNSGDSDASYPDTNQTTEYAYDGDNHVTFMTAVMPSGENNQITEYVYGGFGSSAAIQSNDLLRCIAYPDPSTGEPSSSASNQETYAYDAFGEVIEKIDRNGTIHFYNYDVLGRQISDAVYFVPDPTAVPDSSFEEGDGTPWTSGGDSDIEDVGSSAGHIGSHAAVVGSDDGVYGGIYQYLDLQPGTYAIRFASSLNDYPEGAPESGVEVGVWTEYYFPDLLDETFGLSFDGGFTTYYTASFTLTSETTVKLSFSGVDASANVDDVYLVSLVPAQPSSPSYTGNAGTGLSSDYVVTGTFVESTTSNSYGNGQIQETVTLGPGNYHLDFALAQDAANVQDQVVEVDINGESVGTFDPGPSSEGTALRAFSADFTIDTPGTQTITFKALADAADGDATAWLDNVELDYLPSGSLEIDTSILRIDTSFNNQGLQDTVTSYDATSGGNIVNQVKDIYNGFGQITAEYQQHNGNSIVTSGTSQTLHVSYGYSDGAHGSRLASLTYPSGAVISYNYGSTGGLNDVIGRLDSLSEGTVTLEAYKYLGLSTVVERDHPQDGVNLTYVGSTNGAAGDIYVGLDRFGRVYQQFWVTGTTNSATLVDGYTYNYDPDGNVISQTNGLDSAYNENFTYDGLARLTTVSRGTQSSYQSFSLDAVGNADTITNGTASTSATYNSQNEQTAFAGNTLAFDNDGNETTDENGYTLVYDAWNRLISVKNSSGTLLVSYSYDGLGRRIIEASAGSSQKDIYFTTSWQVAEERVGVTTSSNGTVSAQYVWSPIYVNALVLRDRDTNGDGTLDERLYATQDANYDVTSMIGATGTVQERLVYDPHGQFKVTNGSWAVQSSDTLALNYTFQDGRQDLTTGLINFQMRDYDPKTYTWHTADPLGYPEGANRYLYASGNPITRGDPTGLDSLTLSNDAKKDLRQLITNELKHSTIEDLRQDAATGAPFPFQARAAYAAGNYLSGAAVLDFGKEVGEWLQKMPKQIAQTLLAPEFSLVDFSKDQAKDGLKEEGLDRLKQWLCDKTVIEASANGIQMVVVYKPSDMSFVGVIQGKVGDFKAAKMAGQQGGFEMTHTNESPFTLAIAGRAKKTGIGNFSLELDGDLSIQLINTSDSTIQK